MRLCGRHGCCAFSRRPRPEPTVRTTPLFLLLPLLGACESLVIGPVAEAPPAPTSLSSTSLDGQVALAWSDDPYRWDPSRFLLYRVWSAAYDLDADRCLPPWQVEGTTVAPSFVVGALDNGVPRCFRISAETHDGIESPMSEARFDTPRFQSDNAVLFARETDDARAGFRFWRDLDGDHRAVRQELAWVEGGGGAVDFAVVRGGDGALFFDPVRPGTRIAIWGTAPIAALSDIDVAPIDGYTRDAIEVVPGWGYVVEMAGPDGYKRFGALRVTWAGSDHLIFEWAFQDDPGNPELLRAG